MAVNVQGINCVSSIIQSIDKFENNVDIILITRGGGSFLDLNEFNDDQLIHAWTRTHFTRVTLRVTAWL